MWMDRLKYIKRAIAGECVLLTVLCLFLCAREREIFPVVARPAAEEESAGEQENTDESVGGNNSENDSTAEEKKQD